MLTMEDVLCELAGEDISEQGFPPGFRFHPTDEELITFYLASKVFNGSFCGVDIAEVDLNRCEPWELPDVAKMGEREWYFFSLRDRKYPTGLRTNRATGAGYWKATGKDREVYSASSGALLGMKKTLVFYKGRAPRGEKTKWVMHEYRLDGDFSYRHTCKEEWVICRIFHKKGERKNPLLQGQNYLLEAASSATSGSLPPLLEEVPNTLLECQLQDLQNSLLTNNQDGLKSLIHPVVSQSNLFPINGFLPSFSTSTTTATTQNTNTNNNPSQSPLPSILFKSLLSHQDCSTHKEQITIQKQCKTEANFSNVQMPADANLQWMDRIHTSTNQYQNSLLVEIDCGLLGLSAFASAPAIDAPVNAPVNALSNSVALYRTGF